MAYKNTYMVIKEVVDQMQFGSAISGSVLNGSVLTVYTDNTYSLSDGMYVTIDNINYVVSSVEKNQSFDITKTDTIINENWKLAINFKFGTRKEINELLISQSQSSTAQSKYPLIWLVSDIEKDYNDSFLYDYDANLLLVFAHHSKESDLSVERITGNVELVLEPLLRLFINNIKIAPASINFNLPYSELTYNVNERLKYNTADNVNILDTITDAIELEIDLQIKENVITC